MALDGKVLRRAMDRYEQQLRKREQETARLREQIYRKDPRISELDGLLRSTVAEAAAIAVSGGSDPVKAIEDVQNRNLVYQDERRSRIRALGYPGSCLDDEPLCPVCGDRGWVGTKPCRCLRKLYAEEQRRELSRLLDLQGESFQSFRLDYYDPRRDPVSGMSPRQNMEMVYQVCRSYAETFGDYSGSLFLTGAPGLGKTFLSACIAAAVAEKGFSVVYDTATHVFAQMEAEKFRREDEDAENDVKRYENCDLLILDDLGTEMNTAFVQSALYQLINGRLSGGKKTVISTNLTPDELGTRYGAAILSRIEGEYRILPFFGEDIRKLKRARG